MNVGGWGSDAVASLLRTLEIPYVVLNPGASYRGLHDSLVNHLGNESPKMLLVLHEEHAVAIAHGWAKVRGTPLAAIVHSNVGLMHASMAIFNAWCDRVPVLVLGATGPMDANQRRPWIDWIHTAADQAALVRPYTKWDDQPGSVPAALESLLRANAIMRTAPCAPVYVCLDASLQEDPLETPVAIPDVARYQPPAPAEPASADLARAAALLANAKSPLILCGRVSRSEADWNARITFAESLGARVLTDLKVAAAFPTDHPLHAAAPAFFLDDASKAIVRESDVVLSLDWLDLGGTLKQGFGTDLIAARVIQCSLDHTLHRGFSMEYQGLPPADVYLAADPDRCVSALQTALRTHPRRTPRERTPAPNGASSAAVPYGTVAPPLDLRSLASGVLTATRGRSVSLLRLPLGWPGAAMHFDHPLSYLGYDGGAGIGSGPGMTVGAALALRGSGRLPVAILGDGDFLMGVTAWWTAAQNEIPFLAVIANNRSYFNDELHQERVAIRRGRPVENRWIGQRIDEPAIDLAAMARAQGIAGIGPVANAAALHEALREAIAIVDGGKACVVDARIAPAYDAAMSTAMTKSASRTR